MNFNTETQKHKDTQRNLKLNYMIQRKQTLYLFFAGLIPLIMLFISFGDIFSPTDIYYKYNAFAVREVTADNTLILSTIGSALLLIATSALSFITIFLYKNRKTQMKLVTLNMVVILIAICVIMYVYPNVVFAKNIHLNGATVKFNYTILISFVSAIGLFLAKKAIAKDEAMIRSADRLR
jgi:glucan phosphoethanolaminetransferase (alkaline phosphatase superfamily)